MDTYSGDAGGGMGYGGDLYDADGAEGETAAKDQYDYGDGDVGEHGGNPDADDGHPKFYVHCRSLQLLWMAVNAVYYNGGGAGSAGPGPLRKAKLRDQYATVQALQTGLQFQVQTLSNAMQAHVLIKSERMDHYELGMGDSSRSFLAFRINLGSLLDCLSLYGAAAVAETEIGMAYSRSDKMLHLALTYQGLTTECVLTTMEVDDDDDEGEEGGDNEGGGGIDHFAADLDSAPQVAKLTVTSDILLEAFKDICALQGHERVTIQLSNESPYFRLHASGLIGGVTVDVARSSDSITSFEVLQHAPVAFDYPVKLLEQQLKALSLAKDVSLVRVNSKGTMMFSHKVVLAADSYLLVVFTILPIDANAGGEDEHGSHASSAPSTATASGTASAAAAGGGSRGAKGRGRGSKARQQEMQGEEGSEYAYGGSEGASGYGDDTERAGDAGDAHEHSYQQAQAQARDASKRRKLERDGAPAMAGSGAGSAGKGMPSSSNGSVPPRHQQQGGDGSSSSSKASGSSSVNSKGKRNPFELESDSEEDGAPAPPQQPQAAALPSSRADRSYCSTNHGSSGGARKPIPRHNAVGHAAAVASVGDDEELSRVGTTTSAGSSSAATGGGLRRMINATSSSSRLGAGAGSAAGSGADSAAILGNAPIRGRSDSNNGSANHAGPTPPVRSSASAGAAPTSLDPAAAAGRDASLGNSNEGHPQQPFGSSQFPDGMDGGYGYGNNGEGGNMGYDGDAAAGGYDDGDDGLVDEGDVVYDINADNGDW